jgi:hypothetical protein
VLNLPRRDRCSSTMRERRFASRLGFHGAGAATMSTRPRDLKSSQLNASSGPIRGVAPAFKMRTSGRVSTRICLAALSSVMSAENVLTPRRALTASRSNALRATTLTLAP